MMPENSLLTLDLGLKDCLYRILRHNKGNRRVLYVQVKDLNIIPEESQTYGPEVIRELSKLNGWYDAWDTLTVYKNETRIQSERNLSKPHALPKQHILGNYECIDIFEFQIIQSPKNRVFLVQRGENRCFLKIARFGFELGWLAQQIKAYHVLTQHNSDLSPRLLGYVFESTPNRVIGFIFEEIIGRNPSIADLGVCEMALRQLHGLDIIHGDTNKHNIFITSEGVRFIDFEDSCVGSVGSVEDWRKRKSEEVQNLVENLSDESGRGQPWTFEEDA